MARSKIYMVSEGRNIMIYEMLFFAFSLSIIFLGLQGLYPLSREKSLCFVGIGNINMLIYSASNYQWELFGITALMMIAQYTRVNL